MLQAALGDIVAVKTPDGEEKIKILEGTQPGTVHTIKGKGVPYLNSFGRGDLHVQFNVKIPSNWSGSERKILKDLAKSRKENISPQERGVLDRVKDFLE
jgi:molecular chaperone DnaJ